MWTWTSLKQRFKTSQSFAATLGWVCFYFPSSKRFLECPNYGRGDAYCICICVCHLCICSCICICMNKFSSLNLRGHFGQNIWCHGRQIWTDPEVWSGSYFNLSQRQIYTLLWQYVRVWQKKWSDSFFRCALADMFRYVKQAVQFLFQLFVKELCHWKFST